MGQYEPDDSRQVTGAGNNPAANTPRADGSVQRQQGQMQQLDSSGGQMGGGQDGSKAGGNLRDQIREHMEVSGADGVHVGTVDHVDGDRIKLTKRDSGAGFEGGTHSGHHHYLPLGLVAGIEGNNLRLSANGDVAYGMEQEKDEG